MKKTLAYFLPFMLLGLVVVGTGKAFAQTQTPAHTLSDYGLTAESVKYLTPAEIQQILSSKTPTETIAAQRAAASSTATSTIQFTPPSLFPAGDTGIPPTGTVNCFDYYHFGSVQTDMSLQSSSIIPGMTAQFTGTITNSNDYPVINGTLYVKIFKIRGTEKDVNGPDVIDQFIAMDNITIASKSSTHASFPWKVPLYAQGGDYRLATYFVTDKKFYLLGLSFTDDVVGNTFDFKISSNDSIVNFDKSAVTINNSPYFFAAYPPGIEGSDSANIISTINNNTNKDETVKIEWKLYSWDSINPENFIRTISTSSLIKAHSLSKVNITIPDKEFPVYLLVGELTYKDTKSILNIRYVRDGIDRIRLSFPSIAQFPIVKNATSTIFSCVHNTGTSSIVPNSKVILELKDSGGNIINSYTYTGSVTGEMMAVKKDFISNKNFDNFSLHAELWQAGKLVDQSTIIYNCNSIDPTKCNKNENGSNVVTITILGIIALALIILGFVIHKNKYKIIMLLFIAVFISFGLFFTPNSTYAAQTGYNYTPLTSKAGNVIWSTNVNGTLQFFWDYGYYYIMFGMTKWVDAVKNPYVSIQYKTELRMASTNALIADRSSVPVGTNLIFKFLPHLSTDISWFGTANAGDSPYGEWSKVTTSPPAPPPPAGCNTKDIVARGGTGFLILIPLVVAPPIDRTITNTNGMSCGQLSGDETRGYSIPCTVTIAGPLNPKLNFSSTFGNFYYRDDPGPSVNAPGKDFCEGTNVPLRVSGGSTYTLIVPTTTVQYNLTATAVASTNQPPLPPTITGPTTGQPGTSYTFNVVSTDPDNDQIQYGVDWDNNGTIDQYLPATGFVDSGTSESAPKSWADLGTHTFEAMAIDSHGATSTWTQYSINLSNPTNTNILTVTKAGTGTGTVAGTGDSVPNNNINCGTTCIETVTTPVSVTLTATPSSVSTFSGWSGACTNTTGTCTVNINGAVGVTATFTANTTANTLTVSTAGSGSGTVTGTGDIVPNKNINCISTSGVSGGTCTETVAVANTPVTLTAAPSGGTFSGWTVPAGTCIGTVSPCTVNISGVVVVTATFTGGTPPTNTSVSCLVATTTGANNSIIANFTASVTNLISGDAVLYSWDGNAYSQSNYYSATYLSTPTSPQEVWAHEYSGGTIVNTGNAFCPSVTVPTSGGPTVSSCTIPGLPAGNVSSPYTLSLNGASATASGGFGGYTYSWSDDTTNFFSLTDFANIVTNLGASTYIYVKATDSSGATSLSYPCGRITVGDTPPTGGPSKPELWPGQPGDNTSNKNLNLYFSDPSFGQNSAPLIIHRYPGDSPTVSFDTSDLTGCVSSITSTNGISVQNYISGWDSIFNNGPLSGSTQLPNLIQGIYTLQYSCAAPTTAYTNSNPIMAALHNLFATTPLQVFSNKVEIDVTPSTVREQ